MLTQCDSTCALNIYFELGLWTLIKNFEIVLVQNNTQCLFAKTISFYSIHKGVSIWAWHAYSISPFYQSQCSNLWTNQQYASIIWPICFQPFKNSLFWSQVQPQNANIRLQPNTKTSLSRTHEQFAKLLMAVRLDQHPSPDRLEGHLQYQSLMKKIFQDSKHELKDKYWVNMI